MRVSTKLILALFCWLPLTFTLPGRAWAHLTGMADDTKTWPVHALLVPSSLLALALLIVRVADRAQERPRAWTLWTRLGLGLWFIGASISCVANAGIELVGLYYVAGFVSAVLVYTALRNMPLAAKDVDGLILALSLGTLVPMLLGLKAYYESWGIPDLATLLDSRYDLERMASYQKATFGNTGNTAAFLVLAGPAFLAMALDTTRRPWERVWFGLCLVPVLLNLMIVQSRDAFLVVVVLIPVFFYFRRPGKVALVLLAAAALFVALQLPTVDVESEAVAKFGKRMHAAVTLDTRRDAAVAGRFLTIQHGWEFFVKYWAAGIGPGASRLYIRDTAVHQFNLQQGVEVGVFGLIGTLLLSAGVFGRCAGIVIAGPTRAWNRERFILIIGPTGFLLYGIIGNMPLTIGIANTWIVLLVAFIALVEFRPVEVVQSQVRPAFDPDLEAVLQARAGHAAPAPRRRPSLDPAAGAQS